MNEKSKNILARFKNGKLIFIIGIIGIILIYVTSLFPKSTAKNKPSETEFNAETYINKLEKSVAMIVSGITGNNDVSVVITLDTGIQYNYADETKISESNKESSSDTDSATDSEKKHIVVTDANGNEKALVVSEKMPDIRGVAVVYNGVSSEETKDKIKNAVMAALGVTSKRVYIASKGG